MVALYATCLIVMCNSLFLFSMEQPSGFLVPLNQTLLSLRKLVNLNATDEAIELQSLNQQKQHEQQELLSNSFVPSSDDYMDDLYKKVTSFFTCKLPQYQDLRNCIKACKYVKRFNINEDDMGRFAFSRDNGNQTTSLFFYLLKYYNTQAAITREVPPTNWSPFAKNFNLVEGSCDVIELLIKDTNALLFNKMPYYYDFISYIHSNQKFSQLSDVVIALDDNWKEKFVGDACALLHLSKPYKGLRGIIIMINAAKNWGYIKQESDLGYYVLNHDEYDDQKRKIALLCLCIADYNRAAAGKITPFVCSYFAYKTMMPLHIMLPDAFDKDLLNPEKIAFAEYDKLLDDIHEIKESSDEVVEYRIKEKYPPQCGTVQK